GPFRVGHERFEAGERAELGVAYSDGGDEAHAAELAIGNRIHTGTFLQRDRFRDGAVFGGSCLGWTKPALARGGAGLLRIGRARQAPDYIRACNFRQIPPQNSILDRPGGQRYHSLTCPQYVSQDRMSVQQVAEKINYPLPQPEPDLTPAAVIERAARLT